MHSTTTPPPFPPTPTSTSSILPFSNSHFQTTHFWLVHIMVHDYWLQTAMVPVEIINVGLTKGFILVKVMSPSIPE
jgi:hypothetical protein